MALGERIEDAIAMANHVAALSTTKPGAQASMPSQAELEGFLRHGR
jgi:sugar/nucleoside kinase (ribokinase family)